MDSILTHRKMIEETLRREANKLAKLSSQIISNHESSADTILKNLNDVTLGRYVGNETEIMAIISNRKKLSIII